ncbi:MAG: hypothetical protein HC923_02835 [Myxococcales bacterium]|nr:hypothetical protein [Myxococcales bacterium]
MFAAELVKVPSRGLLLAGAVLPELADAKIDRNITAKDDALSFLEDLWLRWESAP